MRDIHPTCLIDPTATLGEDVVLGPYTIVEANSVIGDRCRLGNRVIVRRNVTLGTANVVHDGAILGGDPQHLAAGPVVGAVRIGSGNIFRENVTVHAALKPEDTTVVGDNNLVMVNGHIAHDCVVGNNTIIANNVMLGGHVIVGDRAYLSGGSAVHQFCRVGQFAMVGGQAHIIQDVPPFVTVDGMTSLIVGLNVVGLRRGGITPEQIDDLKAAYRVIYRSDLRFVEILETLKTQFTSGPAAAFHPYLSVGKRGFVAERRSTTRLAAHTGTAPAATTTATGEPVTGLTPTGESPSDAARKAA